MGVDVSDGAAMFSDRVIGSALPSPEEEGVDET